MLMLGNVVLSGSYATTGEKIKMLELEKQHLLDTNADLERTILEFTSLSLLQQKAQHLGFVKPDSFIPVNIPSTTVALSQQ